MREKPSQPMASVAGLLAVLLISIVSSLAVTARPARAATDSITIISAGSPKSSLGSLSVVADSQVPTTAMIAHLKTTSGGVSTDKLDVPLTQAASTVLADGETQVTWSVATPITEAQLPLGNYAINVDVTFADASTTSLSDVGTLHFLDVLTFNIAATPTVLSLTDTVVTLTGSVTSLSPDGTTTPYANENITDTYDLLVGYTPPPTLVMTTTTDANGNIKTTFVPNPPGTNKFYDNVTLSAPAGSLALGESATIAFTAHKDPIKVTAHLSTKTATYGGKLTISGTVTYEPGTTYIPLPNTQVTLLERQFGNRRYATTNAQGYFSASLPTVLTPTVWSATIGNLVYGEGSSGLLPLDLSFPTVITKLHVSLAKTWGLSWGGCVSFPMSIPGVSVALGTVKLQYATSRSGPWHNFATSDLSYQTCGHQGFSFGGTGTAPYNYAYYRAYYIGQKASEYKPGYNAAFSGSVLDWMYADRIAGLTVSPHTVASNGALTVKGKLQYYKDGKWHAYSGQLVDVVYSHDGSDWYWVVKVKTSATGSFSATVKDGAGSATWSAYFEGSAMHLAAIGPGVHVRVT